MRRKASALAVLAFLLLGALPALPVRSVQAAADSSTTTAVPQPGQIIDEPLVPFGTVPSWHSPVVTVASTSFPRPIADGYQGHVCGAQGLYWVFYFDGATEGYRTSSSGDSWSAETTIPVSDASPSDVSFACSGDQVAYVSGSGYHNASLSQFFYRYGTLRSDGSIRWNASEASHASAHAGPVHAQVVFDSNDSLWFQLDTHESSAVKGAAQDYLEIWEAKSCGQAGCALTRRLTMPNGWFGVLVPITDGLGLVYDNSTSGTCAEFWNGSEWGNSTATLSTYDLASSGFSSIGDTMEIGYNDPGNRTQGYVDIPYDPSTPYWDLPLPAESDSNATVSIGVFNSTTLALFIGNSTGSDLYLSPDSGTTWSNVTMLSPSEPGPVTDMDAVAQTSGNLSVVWAAGGTIRFETVKVGQAPAPNGPPGFPGAAVVQALGESLVPTIEASAEFQRLSHGVPYHVDPYSGFGYTWGSGIASSVSVTLWSPDNSSYIVTDLGVKNRSIIDMYINQANPSYGPESGPRGGLWTGPISPVRGEDSSAVAKRFLIALADAAVLSVAVAIVLASLRAGRGSPRGPSRSQ
jgi:hypothetical protein